MSNAEQTFSGLWQNERGSRMRLVQDSDPIVGAYITRIGDDRVVDDEHPLVGRATGLLIGFSVAWSKSSSLTSWAGRLVERPSQPSEIHTVWHLVRESIATDPPRLAEPWESFLTYTSVFKKIG